MWHRLFLKTDRNGSELNMEYIRDCVERWDSGIRSDNTWTAKLIEIAYNAGYEAGKADGEESATNQMMQVQLLTLAAPMGNA